ncbi:hypothetical protein LCGC14_1516850 [marine sediment metagenome]|uniref:Uncharacterized protein n=1 Tax=marine sediment metagenome TaxID=412755 RepID=A0A0F9M0X6_9ZZZZ
MARYYSDGISEVPFLADEDLTAYQYKLVKPASAEGYVEPFDHDGIGSGSAFPVGVLVNDPSAGQEASVKTIGFTKVKGRVAACNLTSGAWVRAASDGLVEAASVTVDADAIMGRWFGPVNTTVGASILGNVFLTPFAASGATLLAQ